MKKEIIIIAMILSLIPGLVSAIIFLSPNPYNVGNAYPGDTGNYNLTIFNEYFKTVTISLGVNSSSENLTCSFNSNSTTEVTIPTFGTAYPKVNYSVSPAASPGNHSCYVYIYVPDLIPPNIYLISPANGSLIRPGKIIDLDITDNIGVWNAYWFKSTIFSDGFNNSNNWQNVTGKWGILNNEYNVYSAGGDAQSYLKNLTFSDTSIETNFKILIGTTGNEWVGIHARKTNPADNYATSGYIAYIRYNDEIGIYKAGYGNLATTTVSYNPGTFNNLKFVLSGNVLKLMLNGDEILNTTDNTFSNGYVSLWSGWSSQTNATFDDVKITDATILNQPYDIDTTTWPNGLTKLDVFAYDQAGNSNHSTFVFNFDNIPPRVENPYINASVELGDNVFVRVDAWDENGVDKVILERYADLYKFDFGMDTSPVENEYTQLTRLMLKNATNDFGWVVSPNGDRNRSTGTDLTRDLIFDSVDRTFLVNVSNGKYLVTAIIGDMDYSHDTMNVYAEDQLKINNVNTSAGQIKWLNFTVNVNDGQLTIRFNDSGGIDPNWICNGLIIRKFIQSYNMNKLVSNTYTTTILSPPLGNYAVLYFANDTVGNINDTVTGSFNVTMPPPPKVTSVTISPSIIFNNTIFVKSGNTKFNITFDKNMNTSVQPTVKFGLSPVIIDDGDSGYNDFGPWVSASGQGYNNDVRYISAGTGSNNATWAPNLTATGNYNIYVSWTTHPNRATNANYTIYYNGGNYSFTVNQENYANGSIGGSSGEWSGWYYAGTFNFAAGTNGKVVLNDNANEYVIADAVKFESTKNNFVIGNWINPKLWSGSYTITNSTGDGNNTLNITGAKSLAGIISVENTSTWFIIGTTPRFISVIISPSVDNTYIKAGNISFTIIFNQAMNQSVKPTVTFGQSQPYNMYSINGSWINSTTWIGYYNFTPNMSNKWYTISISGAQDSMGSVIPQDTSYKFLLDTRLPKIWDIQTSDITFQENETITIRVNDEKPAAQDSSGLDTVIVKLNGGVPYTMNFGYAISYIGSADYVYYLIINNTQFGNGTQNLTFYVKDIAGNINSNSTTFYVSNTTPKVGGKIAFLCNNNPVGNTCNDDIENKLISWLRSQNWTVDVNVYYVWNKTGLSGHDLIMCSDERYACDYATRNTNDVYYAHKTLMIPFVEISDDGSLRAATNFGYVSYPGGTLKNNVNSLYVTASHPITSGYFGNTKIFDTNKTMAYTSDIMLNDVKDIADIEVENGRSTFFSHNQLGRFVFVGWFYKDFSGLNKIGNTTLTRAINWAECGNAKGCNPIIFASAPTTTTTTTSTTTILGVTTIPPSCNVECNSRGYASGTCRISCRYYETGIAGNYCPNYIWWQLKCCCSS